MTQHEQRGRSFELSVEVPGTPEEVWRAIATGPGISSWYVPHQVQEQAGGVAVASFGDSPEMQISGRVAAWDPPRRIVFDGGEGVDGLAFEWLIEARTGDTCVVRLINSGFGSGAEWDAQFDGLQEGWPLFLRNLQLHLTHFGGQTATSALPMAPWAGAPDEAWDRLMQALGVPADAGESDRLVLQATGSRSAGSHCWSTSRRPERRSSRPSTSATPAGYLSGHTSTGPRVPRRPARTAPLGRRGCTATLRRRSVGFARLGRSRRRDHTPTATSTTGSRLRRLDHLSRQNLDNRYLSWRRLDLLRLLSLRPLPVGRGAGVDGALRANGLLDLTHGRRMGCGRNLRGRRTRRTWLFSDCWPGSVASGGRGRAARVASPAPSATSAARAL